jgi:hypothetical protein
MATSAVNLTRVASAEPFGRSLHLLGHYRRDKAAARGRLDCGVERQHVGLFGDVRIQLVDLADPWDDSPRR